jgi:hypothetical protein
MSSQLVGSIPGSGRPDRSHTAVIRDIAPILAANLPGSGPIIEDVSQAAKKASSTPRSTTADENSEMMDPTAGSPEPDWASFDRSTLRPDLLDRTDSVTPDKADHPSPEAFWIDQRTPTGWTDDERIHRRVAAVVLAHGGQRWCDPPADQYPTLSPVIGRW